jgi:hypothetical protein
MRRTSFGAIEIGLEPVNRSDDRWRRRVQTRFAPRQQELYSTVVAWVMPRLLSRSFPNLNLSGILSFATELSDFDHFGKSGDDHDSS